MKAKIIKIDRNVITTVQIQSTSTAIPNMLRTIIQSEIPVYAVDVDNIEFGECDTIFPNERIAKIIGLTPVKQNLSNDVSFSLNAKFDKNKVEKDNTCFLERNIITTNDIKSSNGLNYFHPNVPIIELRKDSGILNINKMQLIQKPQLYDARHQACKVNYSIIKETDNSVLTELKLKPVSRQFPEYSMNTSLIFDKAIQIFVEKCKIVRSNIENDIYVMTESNIDNLKIIKIEIEDQPRQFGYVLQSQIFEMSEYLGNEYLVGFHNLHPLKREFIFTMQWNTKVHKGTPKKLLIKALTQLISLIEKLNK